MSQNFKLMFAPMEDNSDSALRTLCHRYGADLTFTEMIRLQSIVRKNKSTLERLKFYDNTPVEIQLLMSNEKDLETYLKSFKTFPGFKGFNLNLGCPSPKIISAGLGCAMMKRISKVNRMIDVFRKYKYQVSLKMRLGLNNYEKQAKAYLNLINNTNPDYFIVHLRHAKQTYIEIADWSVVPEILATGKKIVINGDVNSISQIESLKKQGAYGVMIARAAVRDPSIFNQLKGKEKAQSDKLISEYLELAKKYNTTTRFKEQVIKRLGKENLKMNDDLLI